jgi:hypothetical protein
MLALQVLLSQFCKSRAICSPIADIPGLKTSQTERARDILHSDFVCLYCDDVCRPQPDEDNPGLVCSGCCHAEVLHADGQRMTRQEQNDLLLDMQGFDYA